MKFTANKIQLLEALNITGKAIGTGVLPIMSCYLFKVDDDKIEIVGGSTDVYIRKTIDITPSGITLSIAIPKSKILDLISYSPNQPIHFELLKNDDPEKDKISIPLKVTTSIGEYVIPITPGDDYPTMLIEEPLDFSIPKKDLVKGIESTVFACGDDQLKPAMTGVYVNFTGNKMECAALNGFIVSQKAIGISTPVAIKDGLIIPKKVLSILLGMTMEENVSIQVTDRNIRFSLANDVLLESILIDVKYPDYRSVLPINLNNNFKIRTSQLAGSIKRVSRFADLGTSQLALQLSHNLLSVSTKNSLGDKAEEKLVIDYMSDDLRIGISGKLLQSCLSKITTDDVSLSFGISSQPMILRECDDTLELNTKENLIMVMPMRLDD